MTNPGYKTRALITLQEKGLPVLPHKHTGNAVNAVNMAHLFMYNNGGWAIRVDAPENTGKMHPLYGSNRGDSVANHQKMTRLAVALQDYQAEHPECSFLASAAPNDADRDANIVAYMDGDIMFAEMGFEPMTLRDAWTRGKLCPVAIDGSVGDYLRNRPMRRPTYCHHFSVGGAYTFWEKQYPEDSMLNPFRVDYLRRIRNLIKHYPGMEFEISVMNDGQLIFWQEAHLTEDRSHLFMETLL